MSSARSPGFLWWWSCLRHSHHPCSLHLLIFLPLSVASCSLRSASDFDWWEPDLKPWIQKRKHSLFSFNSRNDSLPALFSPPRVPDWPHKWLQQYIQRRKFMGSYFLMVKSRRKLDSSEKDFAALGNPDGFFRCRNLWADGLAHDSKTWKRQIGWSKIKKQGTCLSTDTCVVFKIKVISAWYRQKAFH